MEMKLLRSAMELDGGRSLAERAEKQEEDMAKKKKMNENKGFHARAMSLQ